VKVSFKHKIAIMENESSKKQKTSALKVAENEEKTEISEEKQSETVNKVIERIQTKGMDLLDMVEHIKEEIKERKYGTVILMAQGISVQKYNDFLSKEHPYSAMFDYEDGNIFIVEIPSEPHEIAIGEIGVQIGRSQVYQHITDFSSSRKIGNDGIGREADKSYVPYQNHFAPGAVLPHGINAKDWITLVFEVGWSQGFNTPRGLRAKANLWLNNYPTVEYVVLIHVSKKCHALNLQLFERGVQNNPTITTNFSHGNHNLALDTKRVLGIPANSPLPQNFPQNIIIDLAQIRERVQNYFH